MVVSLSVFLIFLFVISDHFDDRIYYLLVNRFCAVKMRTYLLVDFMAFYTKKNCFCFVIENNDSYFLHDFYASFIAKGFFYL